MDKHMDEGHSGLLNNCAIKKNMNDISQAGNVCWGST